MIDVTWQGGIVGAGQEMVKMIPSSWQATIIALGIIFLHLQELFIILPVSQHILDVALVNLGAQRLVTN